MSGEGDIEVNALGPWRILRNHSDFLPIVPPAGLFYFFLPAGLVMGWLEPSVGRESARLFGLAAGALVVAAVGGYVWWSAVRMARSRFAIAGNVAEFRGVGRLGSIERRFFVGHLESLTFGVPLTKTERLIGRLNQWGVPRTGHIVLIKGLKAGQLVVTDKTGERLVFPVADKVFAPDELARFAGELARRGVAVSVSPT